MRVRISGLTLIATNGWNTNVDWNSRFCIATDGEGRQLPIVHPLYDLGPAPANPFDATGILLQESGSGTDGTFGYELFVQEISASDPLVLSIGTKPVITWPASLANYQLQARDALNATNWMAVPIQPVVVEGQNSVILNPQEAQRFYRLERVR